VTLIDLLDLRYADAKLQWCKTARPGMKISGKDTVAMDLVIGWWQGKHADDGCWAVVDVPGQLKVLVCFRNLPAGDYHAVCVPCRSQGSGCAWPCLWPCLWCQVRNFDRNARLCKQCDCNSCHHIAVTVIYQSILLLQSSDAHERRAQPACYATTVWTQVVKACSHDAYSSQLWRKRLLVPKPRHLVRGREALQVAAPRGEAGPRSPWVLRRNPPKPTRLIHQPQSLCVPM
jgi:hypothetical protein